MKTWNSLSESDKSIAWDREFHTLMESISEMHSSLFPEIEEEIEQARTIAEDNLTPWFFAEILYLETGAKERIDALITIVCESILYLDPGERAVML